MPNVKRKEHPPVVARLPLIGPTLAAWGRPLWGPAADDPRPDDGTVLGGITYRHAPDGSLVGIVNEPEKDK